jgi:predicted enzyme related to lactoylglutathione lyase
MITGFSVAYHNVKNFKKAKQWYMEKLGLAPDFGSDEMGWQEFKIGNSTTTVSINQIPKKPKKAPRKQATIVFACDDIQQTVAELKKKGVKFQGKIEDMGPVLIATFADLEGNIMQVVQTK